MANPYEGMAHDQLINAAQGWLDAARQHQHAMRDLLEKIENRARVEYRWDEDLSDQADVEDRIGGL